MSRRASSPLLAVAALAAVFGCGAGAPSSSSEPPPAVAAAGANRTQFVDVAAAAGLVAKNVSGYAAKPYIVDSTGTGGCWLDYDRDGHLDIYIVQGSTHPDELPDPPPGDILYRARGDGTFADTTIAAGIDERAWGGGCTIGDVDADGWPDIYVTNHGPNRLWRNRGDGSFEDWTASAGVGDSRWGASAAFADFDGDGDLDLFVANYVVFDWRNPMVNGGKNLCTWHGIPVFCGPRGLGHSRPVYYENDGDGSFRDATEKAGFMAAEATYGLGVVPVDFDRDGKLDLYVANDARPNNLFHNLGGGRFADVSFRRGVAYSDRGKEQAGMGVAAGDYDNDGFPDLFVTNFSEDTYTLYHNDDGRLFTDVSFESGIGAATYLPLGWGTGFFDYDLDGDLDILAANGHVFPQVSELAEEPRQSFRQRPNLLANRDGRFVDVAADSGPGMAAKRSARGAALADYDNDGDLDVLIVNLDDVPTLLRNQSPAERRWLGVMLEGRRSNRDAIGTSVTVRAPGLADQFRAAVPSGSYLSCGDPRVHFGLASATHVDLEIGWPSGEQSHFTGVETNRYVRAIEGQSELLGPTD